MNIIIRSCTPCDVDQVVEIERKSFNPPWTEDSIISELNCSDTLFFVACAGVEVLGFCILHTSFDEGEIYKIAVSGDRRRCGIGDILISDALKAAMPKGVTNIYLEVRDSNIPAKKLYLKHGFTIIGRRKNYYDSPIEDAVIMNFASESK